MSRGPARVAVAQLLAVAAVAGAGQSFFFLDAPTAKVTPLHSGRSPHGAFWAEPAWWGSAPCPHPSVTQRIVQSWSIREHASPPLGCCLSCSRASGLCFILTASSSSMAAAHGLHPTVIPSLATGDMSSHWPVVQRRIPRSLRSCSQRPQLGQYKALSRRQQ